MSGALPTVSLRSRLARVNFYVLAVAIVLVTVFILFTSAWATIRGHVEEVRWRLELLEQSSPDVRVVDDLGAAEKSLSVLRAMPYLESVAFFRFIALYRGSGA